MPDIASIAASTASTPASTAASTVAAAMPDVSWVWKWIGRSISSFSVLTSVYAASGLQQPRHVLDAEDVRAGGLQLAGQLDVVFEVYLARSGREIAGVADRRFAELAGLEHRIDRDAHVLDPVQAVEHAEQVDAGVAACFTNARTTLSG